MRHNENWPHALSGALELHHHALFKTAQIFVYTYGSYRLVKNIFESEEK